MTMHMMIDLETMGSGNDAAIVQIGAVKFDPFVPGEIVGTWKQNVSLESSVHGGGAMDPNTVLWWLNQSEEARLSVFPVREERKAIHKDPDAPVSEGIAISSALRGLSLFYKNTPPSEPCVGLWAHATFDPVVIASAYRRANVALPWSFRDVRDLRTIIWLAPNAADYAYRQAGDEDGPRHDALADALRQVKVVWACIEALYITSETMRLAQ